MTWLINPYRFGIPFAPVIVQDWRLIPHGPQHRDSVFIADIEMAATVGGANLCTGGTASSTGMTGTAANAFDGSQATYCNTAANSSDLATYRYTFSAPVSIGEVRLLMTNSSTFHEQGPLGFSLQASGDGGSTWQTMALITGLAAWTLAESRAFTIGAVPLVTGLGRSNARGWRVNTTAIPGSGQLEIAEIIFAATAGGSAIAGAGYGASACHNGFVRPASQAFDANTSTIWSPNNTTIGRVARFFSAAQDIAEVRIAAGSTANRAPGDFTVQFTEDGVNWTTALTQTGVTGWSSGSYKTFAV